MKLLFDENLSATLARMLAGEYRGSEHVAKVGLLGADDPKIWEHARTNGFTIVSKDTDFRDRSFVEGQPPKVIWLDVGNAGTAAIAKLLRQEVKRVEAFDKQAEASMLILSIGPGGS
ncbi:MAG: DUF5615 family PIN-like protein [Planctomycetota bacterium]